MTAEEIGWLVDQYNMTRRDRLAQAAVVKEMEGTEHKLKAELIVAFKASETTACGGKTAIIKLVIKNEPTAEDIDKLYAHIRSTGEFDLLYRRINPAAIKLRKDVGVDVPGIAWFPVESLSISQIK